MSCLLRGGRVVTQELLIRTTGLAFTQATYMHLSTAAAFAFTKYANKNNSNGTSLSLNWLLQKVKKNSKRFRSVIEKGKYVNDDISGLQVGKTFFEIINCPVQEKSVFRLCMAVGIGAFLVTKLACSVSSFLTIRSASELGYRLDMLRVGSQLTTDALFV